MKAADILKIRLPHALNFKFKPNSIKRVFNIFGQFFCGRIWLISKQDSVLQVYTLDICVDICTLSARHVFNVNHSNLWAEVHFSFEIRTVYVRSFYNGKTAFQKPFLVSPGERVLIVNEIEFRHLRSWKDRTNNVVSIQRRQLLHMISMQFSAIYRYTRFTSPVPITFNILSFNSRQVYNDHFASERV